MAAGLAQHRDNVTVGVRGRGNGELGGMQGGEQLERGRGARGVAERRGGGNRGGCQAAECQEVVRPEEGRRRECLRDPELSVV